MLPTPSTSHVNYERVYEPAEDSFLLLDTLSSPAEQTFLRSRFPNDTPVPLVLEVGTGSGIVLAFVTAHAEHIIGRTDVATMGIDINRFAAVATTETVRAAAAETNATTAVFADGLVGDLTTSIKSESIDMLVFNPPYVPSETVPAPPLAAAEEDTGAQGDSFERDSQLLYLSTDGGADGMEVTDRLLSTVPRILSSRGVAYILLCAQNKPDTVMQRIRSWDGGGKWEVDKVGSSGKKAGWEKLCIIRISRVIP